MNCKLYIKFIFCILLFLYSCEKVENVPTTSEIGDKQVKISVSTPYVDDAAYSESSDYEISSVRILAFHSGTGKMKFNSGKINLLSTPLPITFEILTGTYDFVFIANEHSVDSDDLTLSMDNWNSDSKTIGMLDTEAFHYNAFDKEKPFPATSVYKNVKVTGDYELSYYDSNSNSIISINPTINRLWEVDVERLAIRLDLELLVDESFSEKITKIQFRNLPDKVPFFSNKQGDASPIYYENGYDYTYPLSNIPINDFIKTGPDSDGRYTYKYERIILPASVFNGMSNAEKGITVEIHLSSDPSRPLKGILGQNVPADYTSPRNIYYKVLGHIENNFQFLDIIPQEWSEENISGNGGEKKLNVECLSTSLSMDGKKRIHFWSNQPFVTVENVGYSDTSKNTEFYVNDYFKGLIGTSASNLYYDPLSGSGYIDIEFIEGIEFSDIPNSILYIYLNAGGLKREISLSIDN